MGVLQDARASKSEESDRRAKPDRSFVMSLTAREVIGVLCARGPSHEAEVMAALACLSADEETS